MIYFYFTFVVVTALSLTIKMLLTRMNEEVSLLFAILSIMFCSFLWPFFWLIILIRSLQMR